MIKQIIIVFVALVSLNMTAQEGSTSPYSFFGIGELKFRGTVENKAMGGLSIYADSIHLNLQNPASLGKLKLTTFTVGGNQKFTTLKTDTNEAKGSTTTLDYLAVGLPMGKLGISFGLMPYTAVGYKTGFVSRLDANVGDGRYQGKGGLNKVFLAAGYAVNKEFSLGIDANYSFGKIENEAIYITGVQYDTQEINISRLSGLAINLGANYQKMITNELQLISSLTYSPVASLTSKNERVTSSIIWNNTSLPTPVSTQVSDLGALATTKFKLPSKFTIGAGLSQPKKWFAGIDFTTLSTSKLENRTFAANNMSFENSTKIAVGGFYIPKYNSLTSYLDRIVYRAGMRFENTGLIVNNEKIKEFGMSFGVGLPVGRLFSNMNIGVEYGSRGTTKANLVKENFFNFNLSFSFNDKWFQRRKID